MSTGILLIVDDIQVGCGRTGTIFSFERAGLEPDMIALSKSISGAGLPMSLLLIRPDHDQWKPGEHTGTFRGNNLAFVAAEVALQRWRDSTFTASILASGARLKKHLQELLQEFPDLTATTRGVGMIHGLEFSDPDLCRRVAKGAFQNGLIIETCGSRGNVLKFLPPLTTDAETLDEGVTIVRKCIESALKPGTTLSPV